MTGAFIKLSLAGISSGFPFEPLTLLLLLLAFLWLARKLPRA